MYYFKLLDSRYSKSSRHKIFSMLFTMYNILYFTTNNIICKQVDNQNGSTFLFTIKKFLRRQYHNCIKNECTKFKERFNCFN